MLNSKKTSLRPFLTFSKEKTSERTENIDYVVCQICSRKLKQITHSHLKTHNLTLEEYCEYFPDVETISESTRKEQSKSATGRKRSIESRRKQSKSVSGENNVSKRPEVRKKLSKTKIGNNNPAKRPEVRQKISESKKGANNPNYGKSLSEDYKRKISETIKKGYRTGKRKIPRNAGVGRGNAYFRPDLNQFFRSNYEANIARIFNFNRIKWQYEPQRFDLGECTYLPDYYLPDKDLWIEVKGWIKDKDKKKVIYQLREFSKHHRLLVIDIPAYQQLEYNYSQFIPNWEGKA